MTMRSLTRGLAISLLLGSCPVMHAADPAQGVLDEKVNRLNAQMEDLLIRYQQLQKDMDLVRGELQEFRRTVAAGGGVSQAELKSLEDRIQAVDTARKNDRQAIIDQLAKELAHVSSGKSPTKPTPPVDAKDYVVAKGDTLSSIAKNHKVSIEDLRKANGITGTDIKVGQKLTIPQ